MKLSLISFPLLIFSRIFAVRNVFSTRIFSSLVANDSESGRNSPQYSGNSHDLVNGKVSSLLTKTMENIQLTKQ